jgi:hypothetical protein
LWSEYIVQPPEKKADAPEKKPSSAPSFEAQTVLWADLIKDHVTLEAPAKLTFSTGINQTFAKIRKLVKYSGNRTRAFFYPKARREMPNWEALEKLMLVCMLHHTQSLGLVSKFAEAEIVNPLKSSTASIGSAKEVEENRFLVESLRLLGAQMNTLVDWLVQRSLGVDERNKSLVSMLDRAQECIDDRLKKLELDKKE